MSYGPRGCWRGMCASTLPEPGTPAWLAWRRERCARSLRPTNSSHIKFAITSSAATKRSMPRWPKSSASIARSRYSRPARRRQRTSQSSRMTRSPAFRQSATLRPTCRHDPARTKPSPATTNTRHGTLSLLAGIDLLTGRVHASIYDRHRSREFVDFLRQLDRAYPTQTAIKLILDNHSAHVSKETKRWLAEQPDGRFSFVFTPKHGSWLNLVEGFFSKMTRPVLRHIRVGSKAELKARLLAYFELLNQDPTVHTWTYKLDQVA